MSEYRSIKSQDKLDRIMKDLFGFIREEPDEEFRQNLVSWIIRKLAFAFGIELKFQPELDIDKLNNHLRFAYWKFRELKDDPKYRDRAFYLLNEFLDDLLKFPSKTK